MSDEKEAVAPDVDSMSEKEVADLKNTMRDTPVEEAPKDDAKPEEKPAEKTKPADDDEPGEKQETVPHGQFHRERERRKEAERLSSIATQRLAELLEASRPRQEEQQYSDPDPEPGPDADPIEQLAWNRRQVQALKSFVVGQSQQQRQATEQERAENTVLNQVAARFEEKALERPELNDISKFLAQSYGREFAVLQGLQGISASGEIIPHSPVQQAVVSHIKQIALHCYQNGIAIEDYYENLAKARGWQPKGAQNGTELPRNPDGTFAKQEAERIDKLEADKKRAKSLGGTGAPVEMSEITPQALIDMSDDDFAAYKKKHGENAMRKAMGAIH